MGKNMDSVFCMVIRFCEVFVGGCVCVCVGGLLGIELKPILWASALPLGYILAVLLTFQSDTGSL